MKRVLVDELIPRPLVAVFQGFELRTVADQGWGGKNNGELLRLAEDQFDVFLTGDRNVRFQQNLSKFRIGIVVMAARSTKLEDLLPLVPATRDAMHRVAVGQVIEVGPE
ncbi:MAG: hypothetical protein ACREMQ_15990 [Longimicrobiales bacterium]